MGVLGQFTTALPPAHLAPEGRNEVDGNRGSPASVVVVGKERGLTRLTGIPAALLQKQQVLLVLPLG